MSRNFETYSSAPLGIDSVAQPLSPAAGANGSRAMRRIGGTADDEIARLVQRLFFSPPPAEQHKLVVFCGIDRRAGCSWVCAKAAELLATQSNSRVCAIDANLRSPSLHEHFYAKAGPGFAEAMKQPEPIDRFLSATRTEQLLVMTSGDAGRVPNGALNPARIKERFAALREKFDFLLVDAPAISLFSDAVVLGQVSDGLVLVVASNSTRRDAARTAKQALEDANVPILGAVLNKRTYPIPEVVYRRL